jgi:N-acetylmuramoyl-L-alanine amidase
MRKINHIVVHCSATPEGKDYSIDTIRKWHTDRGWRDIGYHAVIYRNGEVHQGRRDNEIGAGVRGHNKHSIHLCYVGGVEKNKKNGNWIPKDTRTIEQKEALIDLCNYYKNLHPKAEILGHRDFIGVTKSCPSFDAKSDYKVITDKFSHLDLEDEDSHIVIKGRD